MNEDSTAALCGCIKPCFGLILFCLVSLYFFFFIFCVRCGKWRRVVVLGREDGGGGGGKGEGRGFVCSPVLTLARGFRLDL